MSVITYEIHVYEINRGWVLYCQTKSPSKQAAIEEAIDLESQIYKPTKVVRDIYDEKTKTSVEQDIYTSPKTELYKTQGRQKTYGLSKLTDPSHHKKIKSSSPEAALLKFSLSALFFTILSIIMATLSAELLKYSYFNSKISLAIIIIVFFATFFTFIIPLIIKYYPDLKGESSSKKQNLSQNPILEKKKIVLEEAKTDLLDYLNSLEETDKENQKNKKEAALLEKKKTTVPSPKKEESNQKPKENPETKKENILKEEPVQKEETQKHSLLLMTYLMKCLQYLKDPVKKMDPYTKIGLHLYLSGACEALYRNFKEDTTQQELLTTAITTISGNKLLAESYQDQEETYKTYSYAQDLWNLGKEEMLSFLKTDIFQTNLPNLLLKWKNQNTDSTLTLVFTDIIGSTSLTEEYGDDYAQSLIRDHNKIIRNQIEEFKGHEVKTIGDGFMITFTTAKRAIEFSSKVLKEIQLYNTTSNKKSLSLRIGIHTGETVSEDNDYFGRTVQIASRLCDHAPENTILCSKETIKSYWSGDYAYEFYKNISLKGIQEEQETYQIQWQTPYQTEKTKLLLKDLKKYQKTNL